MPGRDGTGPLNSGPVGRRLVPCSGNVGTSGYGSWVGRGMRRGWRAFPAPFTQEEEKQALEQQKGWLQQQLDAIAKRISEMSK